jgi:hypothetical protein
MILPSKHISENQALLGVGAVLLREIKRPQTLTSLWEKVHHNAAVGTFERFILALDLLHVMGLVALANGMIEKPSA